MVSTREHPLPDLGKVLRDRLGGGLDVPSDRMRELLERMAGLRVPPGGSEGGESRPGSEGPGA
jgi:hypothetical protein